MFSHLLKHCLLKYRKPFLLLTIIIALLSMVPTLFITLNLDSNMYIGLYIGILLIFILLIFTVVFFIVITIKNYISTFHSNEKYLTNTLPVSTSQIVLANFISFIIVGYILVNALIIPSRIINFIYDMINHNEYYFFFNEYFSGDQLNNSLSLILFSLSMTFYLSDFFLCLNISKQPKFASKPTLTVIISMIISIGLYEAIINLITLSIINLTLSYVVSIILVISLIGIEVILIIKTLKGMR